MFECRSARDRADEWHHPQSRGLGGHQLMGALVRAAGCENAGDAVAPKYFEHLVERIERIGLLVVVQVRVEKLKLSRRLLSLGRGAARPDRHGNDQYLKRASHACPRRALPAPP